MPQNADDEFFQRADAHLRVAGRHLGEVSEGHVSASLMYACARFNAWVSASRRETPAELKLAYGETIEYFIGEYRKMLVKNLDDYVDNFAKYRPPGDPGES